MGRGKEKEICIGCKLRYACVELIYAELCPKGLHHVSLNEARNIQAVWSGEMMVCPTCNGEKFVKTANQPLHPTPQAARLSSLFGFCGSPRPIS